MFNRTRAGGFILSEEPGSRDQVTIQSGAGICIPGTVLGKITANDKFVPSPATGSDGSQAACAVLFDYVDATDADVNAAAVTRGAAVGANELVFDASVGPGAPLDAKYAQLRAAGIVVRG
jgi:hypothetical protein